MAKKGAKVKKARKADDEKDTVTLRINPDDRDDFTELFRRCKAAGVDEISVYIKQLLIRFLHPDPSGEKAIRELVCKLHDLTRSLHERVEKLDTRTKSLRQTVAKSTTMVLIKTAGWPPDKARDWVQKNLLE